MQGIDSESKTKTIVGYQDRVLSSSKRCYLSPIFLEVSRHVPSVKSLKCHGLGYDEANVVPGRKTTTVVRRLTEARPSLELWSYCYFRSCLATRCHRPRAAQLSHIMISHRPTSQRRLVSAERFRLAQHVLSTSVHNWPASPEPRSSSQPKMSCGTWFQEVDGRSR